jgi:hypothetical protein
MTEVPLWRLYLLRACYLVLAVGLGLSIWPGLFHHAQPWTLTQGIAHCLLAALGLLAVLGIRYPLRMLPLLMFEFTWKAIWLVFVGLPAWPLLAPDFRVMACECVAAMVLTLVVPWRHLLATPADRWR